MQLREGLGTSFIVVTHDLQSIYAISQHAIFIENGHVVAEGSLQDIRRSASQAAQDFLNTDHLPRNA